MINLSIDSSTNAEKGFNEEQINSLIKQPNINTNLISDGYHTFEELYEHRIILYIALCKHECILCKSFSIPNTIWRSKLHSDGSSYEGWFVLGMGKKQGIQITYHLPISKWNNCDFAETLDKAPEYDGHTSKDVLNRLQQL